MVACIILGLDAIRRRDSASHGEWMTRAYAIGLGAGTQVLAHLLWLRPAVIIGPVTLLSAVSASGTLALARMGARRELPDASADVADMGLTEAEKRELLGGRNR